MWLFKIKSEKIIYDTQGSWVMQFLGGNRIVFRFFMAHSSLAFFLFILTLTLSPLLQYFSSECPQIVDSAYNKAFDPNSVLPCEEYIIIYLLSTEL